MQEIPYEIYNNKIGVQARFLFSGNSGKKAAPQSLQLASYDAVNYKIKQGVFTKLRPQANSQPLLISFESLPPTWQTLLTKAFGEPTGLTRQSQFAKLFSIDTHAMAFYSAYTVEKNGKTAYLTDADIQEYTLNASVLNTLNRFYKQMVQLRKSLRGEITTAWDAVTNDCNRFRDIQPHTLPEHKDNLRKKLKAYTEQGYKVLVSGKKLNANARIVTSEIEQFFNDLFAGQGNKPNASEVARTYESFLAGYLDVVNNATGEIYDCKDFKPISKSTIQQYLAKWENEIGNESIRSGDRQKLMSKFKPYHSLQQPKFAGSIISVDDRQPPFTYDSYGNRMWFYNAIDLGSEAFTCWVYGTTKEGIIIDFYRQLVRNYHEWGFNLPAELEGEMSLNASFKDTFLKPGAMFQYVRIEANNARGKRIEAYYKQLRYGYEKEREGWLARPFALSEANQKGATPTKIIPKQDIVNGCLADIENWNNAPHSKIIGKTRWEVFTETQHPNILPTNYRQILPYLGFNTTTTCKAGIIKLNNTECLLAHNGEIATGANLIVLMQQAEGKQLSIYWLDDNDGNILKAHMYIGEKFIGEAATKPTYNRATIEQTPADLKARELMSKYVATVEAYMKTRRANINPITVLPTEQAIPSSKLFSIRGLPKYTPTHTPEPEIMEEPPEQDEEDLIPVSTGFKRKLIDTY